MIDLRCGDCRTVLATLPAGSVDCVVTSPPYFGLRDYGVAGQLGLERTPAEYVAKMVAVFAEVRRVLRPDGTVWLNLGDSYAGSSASGSRPGNPIARGVSRRDGVGIIAGLKPKDLIGIPWRVAFALQADGWYLRSDIIWHKPNPMPESVRDRPTKAHEYLFLLAKQERYYYDAEAIREADLGRAPVQFGRKVAAAHGRRRLTGNMVPGILWASKGGRNRRSVWTISPKPFKGAHFAVMPEALVTPCILAGCRPGGTVLDPFSGAGTVAVVAQQLGRNAIGIDLNRQYHRLARKRLAALSPALTA